MNKKIVLKRWIFKFKAKFSAWKNRYVIKKIGEGTLFVNNYVSGQEGGGIYLGRNVVINSCTFHFEGKSNVVYIGDNVQLNNVEFFLEDCCNVIEIGDSTTMEGGQLAACEGTRIRIGADCMFAKDVNFRTTDSHSIISMSGKRLNKAADIIVGNHVWIGTGALLLKGTILPDNAVVAAKSVVTSQLLVPNAIYGGVPVKILKENISWCRERI